MMNAMTIDANAVKKDLYKSKAMAKFSHYVSGNLYYTVELEDGTYQFPISTIQDGKESAVIEQNEKCVYVTLSDDLGMTPFYPEMRGSELNRWIAMAIKAGEFVKVS